MVHGYRLDQTHLLIVNQAQVFVHQVIKLGQALFQQEKSYVTGLEAANRTVDYLEEGSFAKIIPVEEDEPHIQTLRSLNRSFNDIKAQLPLSSYFLQ